MNKGDCSKCGQKIQKTMSDKCMYCGAPLEAAQFFTEEEKETISLNKKLLRKELHEKEMERLRKGRKSTAAFSGFDIEIGLGGFGDGNGGG
jgi:DNA-directed RNA polymerase subunit RPC12/RpoP